MDHDLYLPGGDLTKTLSFLPGLAADAFMPLLLADRGLHLARDASGRNRYARFEHILVPGRWHAQRLKAVPDIAESVGMLTMAGSLRVDQLREMQRSHVRKRRGGHGVTVLLAPSSGNWLDGKGRRMGLDDGSIATLCALLRKRCDLRHVPHPAQRYSKFPIGRELLDADLVISDYSSVIYEAWALGKPVIFPRWLFGASVIDHAPASAEGHVLKHRIGLHPDRPEELLALLEAPPSQPGPDVDLFMDDFLANYRGGSAAAHVLDALTAVAAPVPSFPGVAVLRREVDEHLAQKNWAEAERIATQLIAYNGEDPDNYDALAKSLHAQNKWWQEIIALERLTSLAVPEQAGHWFRLGQAQENMRWHCAAARSYGRAIALKGKAAPTQWHYLLGYVLETPGHDGPPDPVAAQQAYARAIEADSKLNAASFGIGVFHQERGYWRDAALAYSAAIAEQARPEAELHYRAGMAWDRCYDWAEAELHYSMAVLRMPRIGNWNFRLGFVRERQGKYPEAAEAYAMAVRHAEKHTAYWIYRLAYVLEKAGETRAACLAFLHLQPDPDLPPGLIGDLDHPVLDCLRPQAMAAAAEAEQGLTDRFRQGLQDDILKRMQGCTPGVTPSSLSHYARYVCEAMQDWDGAARYHAAAAARSNRHEPALYYALGRALTFAGRPAEACEAFRSYRVLQQPHGLNEATAKRTDLRKLLNSYAEYLDVLPIRPRSILFESFNGHSLTCNPYALYRHMRSDPRFDGFSYIWTCNSPQDAPDDVRLDPQVVLVQRESDLYLRAIASCEYLVNNSGFPYYFIRREGQKYLATWHGTPLKTLGKRQKYKFFDHKRTQRNFLQATHIISPNPHTTQVYLDDYDLRGLYAGHLGETGYPRIDRTLTLDPGRRREILQKLGLSGQRRVVFYAPTWRGTLSDVAFDTDRLVQEIKGFPKDVDVIFRGHSLLEDLLSGLDLGCTVVPKEIESNEVLAITDILITDYSSIFFDFIPRNKPIILYVYDEEAYEAERGMYFPIDDMPGLKVRSHAALVQALTDLARAPELVLEGYEAARARFCPHEDGQACARTVAFFFDDAPETRVAHLDDKTNVLIHPGSLQSNGITTAFVNLHHALRDSPCRLVTLFSPAGPETDRDRREQFDKLDIKAAYVPRFGYAVESFEEGWLRKQQGTRWSGPLEGERAAILARFHGREYRRIMGGARVDAVVSYSGYDTFFQDVLASSGPQVRRIAVLHNDMHLEFTVKFPELVRNFETLASFDHIASVSRHTSMLNQSTLAPTFGIPAETFVPIDNMLDIDQVTRLAKAPPPEDLAGVFAGAAGPVFLSIGRLSIEKDHAKLIHAFQGLLQTIPRARLVILGEGPLRLTLEQQIRDLRLEGRVLLPGYVANPYPLLKRADCFVLSSNHEGQPMVLLEALILGKTIIATDIEGNRGVLEGRGGMLVENSVEGLTAAMQAVVAGQVSAPAFAPAAYQAEALRGFLALVRGTGQ